MHDESCILCAPLYDCVLCRSLRHVKSRVYELGNTLEHRHTNTRVQQQGCFCYVRDTVTTNSGKDNENALIQ